MDPNANLEEQLRLAARIVEDGDSGVGASSLHADRLAELVLALNEWITNGGFLPERWRQK
jgi:hypothetical protein